MAIWAPSELRNIQTNATIQHNIYHMIEHVHVPRFPCFAMQWSNSQACWTATTRTDIICLDRKIFVFVERNMMQHHLLEIYSDRESRPRTEQACTKYLSTFVLSSASNCCCIMDNLFLKGHLSFVSEIERQFWRVAVRQQWARGLWKVWPWEAEAGTSRVLAVLRSRKALCTVIRGRAWRPQLSTCNPDISGSIGGHPPTHAL